MDTPVYIVTQTKFADQLTVTNTVTNRRTCSVEADLSMPVGKCIEELRQRAQFIADCLNDG